MTKVKICGITNTEDALLCVKFGADALGFNFYPKSPRYIEPEKSREIIEQLPKEVLKVGVFVNESLEKITEIAETAKLDALQLHGEETPEFAKELKAKTALEIIKAFRVSPDFQAEDVLQYETDAILLDAYSPKEYGGTGETFDWRIARKVRDLFPNTYLAGGLSQHNVSHAIDSVKPLAVDTCSGVESKKGIKDKVKLINFIKVSKYYSEPQNAASNIYELLWRMHPNLGGIRLSYNKLSLYEAFLTGFEWGEGYSQDFDWKQFYSKFRFRNLKYKLGLLENHEEIDPVDFELYVRKKYQGSKRHAEWYELIIEAVGQDNQDAVFTFFALLEEFRLEKENLGNG